MFDLSKKTDIEKAQFIVQRDRTLKERRRVHDALREIITKLFSPRSYNLLKNGFSLRNRKNTNTGATIYSPACSIAKQKFARGFTGYTTSREPFWLRFATAYPKLRFNDQVKTYMQESEEQVRYAFNQSTFYKSVPHLIEDATTVGPAVVDPEYDIVKDRMVFKPKSHWLCWFDVDSFGTPNVYHEECEFTALQCYEKFVEGSGEDIKTNLPQTIIDEALGKNGKDPFTLHKFIYAVYINPNAKQNPKKSLDKKCIGYYVLPIGTNGRPNVLVEEKGRDWMPLILRMGTKDGQVYNTNRTLAAEALTTGMMMNTLGEKQIKLVHLAVEPPLWAPKTLRRQLKRNPNGVTFYNSANDEQVKRLSDYGNTWPMSDAQMDNFDGQIDDIFFLRFFELLSNPDLPQITAYQASQMAGEKAVLMSPLTEDFEDDILTPGTDLMWIHESNALRMPSPPAVLVDSLRGRKVVSEFHGPLAQLRRSLLTSKGSLAGLDVVGMVGKLFPESMRKLKGDDLIEDLPVQQGMSQKYFMSDDELAEYDAILTEQRQKEEQMQMAAAAADAMPKLSGAVDPSSPLAQAGDTAAA
jgi:hypothetical protein